MDVIDLCDDENDLDESTNNKRNLAFMSPRSDVADVSIATPNKPILKVIAIEKLTSLSESPVIAPPKRTSRRKSVLHPIMHDENDSIEFMDLGECSTMTLNKVVDIQNALAAQETQQPVEEINDKAVKAGERLIDLDDMPNPNLELMRRVAFLRVSIQHTLNELGLSPVKFENISSWGNLRAQYIQNKKIKEKNVIAAKFELNH